jgi:hypothetical protein
VNRLNILESRGQHSTFLYVTPIGFYLFQQRITYLIHDFDLTGVKKSILSEKSFCMLLARLLESRVRLEKADRDRAPVLLNPLLLANRNYFCGSDSDFLPVTVLVATFDKLRFQFRLRIQTIKSSLNFFC